MGLASGVAGIFAATQQKRAAGEAMRILAEAKNMAFDEAGKLKTTFDPIVKEAMTKLGVSFDTIQGMITDTQNLDTGEPLNASDRIAMEDATRLMNENLAKTGNLRSGAAAFGNAELTRRVLADAMTRNFDREMQKSQLLFGGANMLSGIAGIEANMGMQGISLSENMFSTGLSLEAQRAQAALGKGAALANQIMSVGDLGDSVINMGTMAAAGGMGGFGGMGVAGGASGAMTGAAMAGNPMLSSMMMMSNYFKGSTSPTMSSGNNGFNIVGGSGGMTGGYVNAPSY